MMSIKLLISCISNTIYIKGGSRLFHTSVINQNRVRMIRENNKGLFLKISPDLKSGNYKKMNVMAYGSIPGPSLPSDASPNSWKMWIVGALLAFVVPFWTNKLGPLLKLKNEVETVIETAEHVAEIVEKVAEDIEKIADDVGDQLPEGKLKNVAEFIENAAKETAKDAHLADQFIEKVEDVEKQMDSIIDQASVLIPKPKENQV